MDEVCDVFMCAAKLMWRFRLAPIERFVREKTVSSELMPEVRIAECVAIQKHRVMDASLFICTL